MSQTAKDHCVLCGPSTAKAESHRSMHGGLETANPAIAALWRHSLEGLEPDWNSNNLPNHSVCVCKVNPVSPGFRQSFRPSE